MKKPFLTFIVMMMAAHLSFAAYTEMISRCQAQNEKASFVSLSLQIDQNNSQKGLVVVTANDGLIDVLNVTLSAGYKSAQSFSAAVEDGRILKFQRFLDQGIKVKYYNDNFVCDFTHPG